MRHDPEREHEYLYISLRLSKLAQEVTSELRLSHIGITFESPRTHTWSILLDHLNQCTSH